MAIKVDDKLLPEILGGVAGPIYLGIVYLQLILNPRLIMQAEFCFAILDTFFFCILSYSYYFQVISNLPFLLECYAKWCHTANLFHHHHLMF
jgi:hypothetical protein